MKPSLLRLRARLGGFAPLALLAGTLGAAAWLYTSTGLRGHVRGFVDPVPEAVASLELARVLSVEVLVGQDVSEGQVLARLDTATIDAELAIAEAERAKLEGESNLELGLAQRRLDADVEDRLRTLAAQREQALSANAEVNALDAEIKRVRALVESRQALASELTALGLRQATATAIAKEKPKTLALLESQAKAAEQRRSDLAKTIGGASPQLQAERTLALAEKRIEGLKQRRERMVLKATRAGRVASIAKQVGEVAAAGETVVNLVRAGTTVTACIPERIALTVTIGTPARLKERGIERAPRKGVVASLGGAVAALPARCWRDHTVPEYGREIVVLIERPSELVAGQAFDIELDLGSVQAVPPRTAPTPAAATSEPSATAASTSLPNARADAPPSDGTSSSRLRDVTAPLPAMAGAGGSDAPSKGPHASVPSPITLPPSLEARTRFEPSGLVARASEHRYLLVSDDTGRDETEGIPWLFAMSAQGAVAPEPIVLEGLRELSDLEAITEGASGELYLLASQSYSKHGKRKPARTALLRVREHAGVFRADGEVHLAELLDANPQLAATLGLEGGTSSLDIEGMTFHDGALLLGLKAPLDANGAALVWKVASPAQLFGEGLTRAPGSGADLLAAAELSLVGKVTLQVELDGTAVPAGISDLCVLPGGRLAVTATPSSGDRAAGALYRIDDFATGKLVPTLLRRFPKQKPEGVALSLRHPEHVALVFDAGASTPWFDEVPWSR
jgi:multidrug resistance efflux pump